MNSLSMTSTDNSKDGNFLNKQTITYNNNRNKIIIKNNKKFNIKI